MGQPATRTDGSQLFHVNFHTVRKLAVFESPEYQRLLEQYLPETIARWSIPCLAWKVMPTHVHLVIVAFPDLPLGRAMNLIKGATARALLLAAPELRADVGSHLWQEGYDWVEITSHQQCTNAVRYVNENRRRGGLE